MWREPLAAGLAPNAAERAVEGPLPTGTAAAAAGWGVPLRKRGRQPLRREGHQGRPWRQRRRRRPMRLADLTSECRGRWGRRPVGAGSGAAGK